MPARMLRNYVDSEKFERLSAEAERMFVRLITTVDDYGCFHADPRLLRAALFPLRDDITKDHVAAWLGELASVSLVRVYRVDGRDYLCINNFGQRLRTKVRKFPEIPESSTSDVCIDNVKQNVSNMLTNDRNLRADVRALLTNVRDLLTNVSNMRLEEKRSRREEEDEIEDEIEDEHEAKRREENLRARTRARARDCGCSSELLNEDEAIAQAGLAGVPPDFARMVFQSWFAREGRDAAGVLVPFARLVAKRWSRERAAWESKTHRDHPEASEQRSTKEENKKLLSQQQAPPIKIIKPKDQ